MKEGKPSVTALIVANAVVILGQTGCSLLPPGIVPLQMALLEALKLPWRHYCVLVVLRSCFGPFVSRLIRWFINLLRKDAIETVAFRKSYIEKRVREFLERNKGKSPQVLILAAGYDTLSLRLARDYPKSNFWEIDHPSTANIKTKIWKQGDTSKGPLRVIGSRPKNLFDAAVDLTKKDALVETLKGQGDNYDTSRPTIVTAEGLVMYLTKQQILQMFEEISKAVGPGSVVTCDMVATKYVGGKQQADTGPATPIAELYLKLRGEPLHLGLDKQILREFVDKNDGWSLDSEIQSFGPADLATIRVKSNSK